MTIQYDPDTGLQLLIKQPSENDIYDIDMVDVLREGDTIASIVNGFPAATNMGKVPDSSNVTISSEAHNNGTIAQCRISGGQHGENYKITFRVSTQLGSVKEVEGMLYVRDL